MLTRADPPSLRDLQERMLRLVVGRPPDDADREALSAWLAPPPRGDLGERLDVHVDGYAARLHEALEETFPAVATIAGARFCALASRYGEATPLFSYNLNDAGAGFPEFLRTDPLTVELAFLPDLAALEWRVARAFHSREAPPLVRAALAAIGDGEWPAVSLRLQPSVAVVESRWPILELWRARGRSPEEIDVDLERGPERVLVRRRDLSVYCDPLDAGEALALRRLLAGDGLGDAAAALAASGHDPGEVSRWFGRWMALGLVVGVGAR